MNRLALILFLLLLVAALLADLVIDPAGSLIIA